MELHDASGTLLQNYPDPQATVGTPQPQQDQKPLRQQPNSQPRNRVPGPPRQVPVAAASTTPSKKTVRMPGTKQCPSCQSTIAAAVAKCPQCPHIFREKKEKVKRSGKRGKKNCPKCTFENPSACSSCKRCKYVFRLKLMDKYRIRSRPTTDSAAAAAAAAAHAVANMVHGTSAVSAVATVPLPAGVAAYPNQIAPGLHPHVNIMPPLPNQGGLTLHGHNVHAASMGQMHPLPQHALPHPPHHPQL